MLNQYWLNVAHSLQHWTNINTALVQRVLFGGQTLILPIHVPMTHIMCTILHFLLQLLEGKFSDLQHMENIKFKELIFELVLYFDKVYVYIYIRAGFKKSVVENS